MKTLLLVPKIDNCNSLQRFQIGVVNRKLVPWGTDGRLPLSDLDLDLGSGYTA